MKLSLSTFRMAATQAGRRDADQRGATLIIILGILSILALVAVSLSYTSKLDSLAAKHFGDAVQRRIAGASGLAVAAPLMANLQQVTNTQVWAQFGAAPPVSVTAPVTPAENYSFLMQRAILQQNTLNQQKALFQQQSAFKQPAFQQSSLGPPFSLQSGQLPGGQRSQEMGGGQSFQGMPGMGQFPGMNQAKPVELNGDRLDLTDCPPLAIADVIYSPSEIGEISDQSALFNLNVLGTWSEFNNLEQPTWAFGHPQLSLTTAISVALEMEGLNQPGLAGQLAGVIIMYKYGPDGLPGRGNYDDNGNSFGCAENLILNGNDDDHDLQIDNPEEAVFSILNDGLDQNFNHIIDDMAECLETNLLDDDGDGEIDEAGEGVDEPAEFNPDPRFRPNGDDNPFDTIEELGELLKMSGVAPEIYPALAKHFTVFSISRQSLPTPPVQMYGGQFGPRGFGPRGERTGNELFQQGRGQSDVGDGTEDQQVSEDGAGQWATGLTGEENDGRGAVGAPPEGMRGGRFGGGSRGMMGRGRWLDENATTRPFEPLPINYATVYEIIRALFCFFPEKDEALIMQFAVNLVDHRDPDSIPTLLENPYDRRRPFLGTERVLVINEVCADVTTSEDDGDDGQYIELFNPYQQSIDLTGWQIEVNGLGFSLSGSIPAEGYLIVTDDYDGSNDPEREEFESYGSFYHIFNKVRNSTIRPILEFSLLNLPNVTGEIRLTDSDDNLIDYVIYDDGTFSGVSRSLQRLEPRTRHLDKLRPTPFEQNSNYELPVEFEGRDPFLDSTTRDRPFSSPVGVMGVYAGYMNDSNSFFRAPPPLSQAPLEETAQEEGLPQDTEEVSPSACFWRWPSIHDQGPDWMDSRVIDLFTIDSRHALNRSRELRQQEPLAPEAEPTAQRFDALELSTLNSLTLAQLERLTLSPSTYGKININTCSMETLMALPAMSVESAWSIIAYRGSCLQELVNQETGESIVPFRSLSDLLRLDEIWGEETRESRLWRFAAWESCLTVNSQAFELIYGPRLTAQEREQNLPPLKFKALIGLDGQSPCVLSRSQVN